VVAELPGSSHGWWRLVLPAISMPLPTSNCFVVDSRLQMLLDDGDLLVSACVDADPKPACAAQWRRVHSIDHVLCHVLTAGQTLFC